MRRKQTQKSYRYYKNILKLVFGNGMDIVSHHAFHFKIGGGDEGFLFHVDTVIDGLFGENFVGIMESIADDKVLVSVKIFKDEKEASTFFRKHLGRVLDAVHNYNDFIQKLDYLYSHEGFLQMVYKDKDGFPR